MATPPTRPPPRQSFDWTAALESVLPEYAVALDPAAHRRLEGFLSALAERNRTIRLVGDASPELLLRRHLGESLALASLLPLDRLTLWDIGSGAGFPGLALALAFPGIKTTLVEVTQKKARFLQEVIDSTGVAERVRVLNRRFEELKQADLTSPPTILTCRALEKMETAPHRLAKMFPRGTLAAFWTSDAQADAWASDPGWIWQRRHRLPASDHRIILLGVPRGT